VVPKNRPDIREFQNLYYLIIHIPYSGCSKAGEQMYLFMGQEEDQKISLQSQLLAAIQSIKQLEPPLTSTGVKNIPCSEKRYRLALVCVSIPGTTPAKKITGSTFLIQKNTTPNQCVGSALTLCGSGSSLKNEFGSGSV
jgi:hypothetical protein